MAFLETLPVTASGLVVATACVVAGAPLFAAGRRALRLRRVFGALSERPLGADASGWVQVSGRVALESPLFAPLSGLACAGFDLEVSGERSRVGGRVSERRPFRLESGEHSAFVSPERARWRTPVTAERTLAVTEALPERVTELLESNAEIRWLRDRRAPLHVVERALAAGTQVTVIGMARTEQVSVGVELEELAATGTDDGVATTMTLSDPTPAGELWLGADEDAGLGAQVHTETPNPGALKPSSWQVALLGIGPAITVAGFLYLARAAGPLVAGRF